MKGMEIGTPVIYDEITFVPILKNDPREDRDYLNLSEALNERACKIYDKGTEVAHIMFENIGELPILVEEGEIFAGQGTQDRICISTVMIQPDEKVEIPVKCVHAPHYLSAGSAFAYGGKCSRGMLNSLRAMKYNNAITNASVSTISQSTVWNSVATECADQEVFDKTQYTQTIGTRIATAKARSNNLNFPKNTIGIVVVNPKGEIKGIEIHRSPNNFNVRKDGILLSLEASVDWKPTGKGPYKDSKSTVKELFTKLSQLEEGKDAVNQIEVNGMVINAKGMTGEVLTTEFYSDTCPKCAKKKPRKMKCPECGFDEIVKEEVAFLSLM